MVDLSFQMLLCILKIIKISFKFTYGTEIKSVHKSGHNQKVIQKQFCKIVLIQYLNTDSKTYIFNPITKGIFHLIFYFRGNPFKPFLPSQRTRRL